jgi:membrane protein YdbS with pleckstrin-like domain
MWNKQCIWKFHRMVILIALVTVPSVLIVHTFAWCTWWYKMYGQAGIIAMASAVANNRLSSC